MGFDSLKCPNCAGRLVVDSQDSSMLLCESCGSRHQNKINDIEINNYTADAIHADVINIIDDESREAQVQAAESSLLLGNYDDARRILDKLTSEHANDYRGWLGLVKADSDYFRKMPAPQSLLSEMRINFANACKMANAKELQIFKDDVERYLSHVQQANKNEVASQKKRIVAAQNSIPEHEKKHEKAQNDYKNQIEKYESDIEKANFSSKISRILAHILIIFGYLCLIVIVVYLCQALAIILLLTSCLVIPLLCSFASKQIDERRSNRVEDIKKKISECKQSASIENSSYDSTIYSLKKDISDADKIISSLRPE